MVHLKALGRGQVRVCANAGGMACTSGTAAPSPRTRSAPRHQAAASRAASRDALLTAHAACSDFTVCRPPGESTGGVKAAEAAQANAGDGGDADSFSA